MNTFKDQYFADRAKELVENHVGRKHDDRRLGNKRETALHLIRRLNNKSAKDRSSYLKLISLVNKGRSSKGRIGTKTNTPKKLTLSKLTK